MAFVTGATARNSMWHEEAFAMTQQAECGEVVQ